MFNDDDFFFFFKQKTAYEMRISDWSSDVCSSDLFYGSLIPEIAGSFGARDRLVEMAETGDPQPLVDGGGNQWGEYVLVNLDETGRNIVAGGLPRRIDFTIDFERKD